MIYVSATKQIYHTVTHQNGFGHYTIASAGLIGGACLLAFKDMGAMYTNSYVSVVIVI